MRKTCRFSGFVVAMSWVLALGTPALAQTPSPIHVNRCNPQPPGVSVPGYAPAFYPRGPYYWSDVYGYRYLQPPVVSPATLGIDYINNAPVPAKTVEFGLVANGRLVAEVRDVGTFSQGSEIKHKFGLNQNVFPLQTSFARCVPLHVTFADGTSWRNPHLPALRASIYR